MSKAGRIKMNEIERNRLEAYLNGWDDGYAEGYAKAQAEAETQREAGQVNEVSAQEDRP